MRATLLKKLQHVVWICALPANRLSVANITKCPPRSVHRCRGTDRRDVVRFQYPDDFPDAVGTFLDRLGVGMVFRLEIVGDLLRREDVGGIL
jgi:hypothetical protein